MWTSGIHRTQEAPGALQDAFRSAPKGFKPSPKTFEATSRGPKTPRGAYREAPGRFQERFEGAPKGCQEHIRVWAFDCPKCKYSFTSIKMFNV